MCCVITEQLGSAETLWVGEHNGKWGIIPHPSRRMRVLCAIVCKCRYTIHAPTDRHKAENKCPALRGQDKSMAAVF